MSSLPSQSLDQHDVVRNRPPSDVEALAVVRPGVVADREIVRKLRELTRRRVVEVRHPDIRRHRRIYKRERATIRSPSELATPFDNPWCRDRTWNGTCGQIAQNEAPLTRSVEGTEQNRLSIGRHSHLAGSKHLSNWSRRSAVERHDPWRLLAA